MSSPRQQYLPKMYPEVRNNDGPEPPPRMEYMQESQRQNLIQSASPPVPKRMDKPDPLITETRERRIDVDYSSDSHAGKKIIGLILFTIALLGSNVFQLRLLILQKQHDGVWIGSLVLVCISILIELGLGYVLYVLAQDNRKSQSNVKSNIVALCMIGFLTLINWAINILMLSVNPKSFLDAQSLEILQRQT